MQRTTVSTVETTLGEALVEAARNKPADCTCDGLHTAGVDPRISTRVLLWLISTESCRAEQRALVRIVVDRQAGLS